MGPQRVGASLSQATSLTRRELGVRLGWATVDVLVVALSLAFASWARLDFNMTRVEQWEVGNFVLVGTATYLVIALLFSLFGRPYPRGSFEETLQIAFSAALLSGFLLVANLFGGLSVPRSLPVTAPIMALVGMLAVRFVVRSYRSGISRESDAQHRAVVYGAGNGGRHLIRSLKMGNEAAPLVPVAVVDDDPRKRKWRIEGVRVLGDLSNLGEVVEATGAANLLIAAPSLPGDRVRDAHERARALGLNVYMLPSMRSMLTGGRADGIKALRQLDLNDLLGRGRVELDASAISRVVMGRSVLVTGAGGSIGSELAKQIARFSPSRLILLDRDESALHGCQLALTGRALLDDDTLALVDIRDEDAVRTFFERERPEVVFHAAALKHLTLLERFPLEAWKTNVLGTLNVLKAAEQVGVKEFVNISTDKAAAPTSVLGYSKRVAECLTSSFADRASGTYVSVRFGNVLGSRGSVLETFRAQIERGGPITVTHPDVERYFMLIPEAAQLVLQAAAIGASGDAMVLDMGEPVKIVSVAQTLIQLSGDNSVTITYSGLRSGEKLSEVLFQGTDEIEQSSHPLIRKVSVPPLSPEDLGAQEVTDSKTALAKMEELAKDAPNPAATRARSDSVK